MFADSDFILALIKNTDWLKESAENILLKNKGKITTSLSVMIELALVLPRFNINILETYANLNELIKIDKKTIEISMKAALFIQEYNSNVFDSFHAASCKDEIIISSDSVYDKFGIERLKLGK